MAAILTGNESYSAVLKNNIITSTLPKQWCVGKPCHFPYIETAWSFLLIYNPLGLLRCIQSPPVLNCLPLLSEQNHSEAINEVFPLCYPLSEQAKITAQFLLALYIFSPHHTLSTFKSFLLKYIPCIYITSKVRFMNLQTNAYHLRFRIMATFWNMRKLSGRIWYGLVMLNLHSLQFLVLSI